MFLHISALQSAGIDPDDIRKGDRRAILNQYGTALPYNPDRPQPSENPAAERRLGRRPNLSA
jgi:hypothetical protein